MFLYKISVSQTARYILSDCKPASRHAQLAYPPLSSIACDQSGAHCHDATEEVVFMVLAGQTTGSFSTELQRFQILASLSRPNPADALISFRLVWQERPSGLLPFSVWHPWGSFFSLHLSFSPYFLVQRGRVCNAPSTQRIGFGRTCTSTPICPWIGRACSSKLSFVMSWTFSLLFATVGKNRAELNTCRFHGVLQASCIFFYQVRCSGSC